MKLKPVISILFALLAGPVSAQQIEAVAPDVVSFVEPDQLVKPGETTRLFLGGDFTAPFEVLAIDVEEEGQAVDGLHRLPDPGQWLFSVSGNNPLSLEGVVTGLPAAPQNFVAKGDVLLYDALDNGGAGSFRAFFCGLDPSIGINPFRGNYDVDVLYLESGDLVVGFEAATSISEVIDSELVVTTYESGDLARFASNGDTCSSWTHVGVEFDASGKIAATTNVLGAATTPDGNGIVFAFDVATCTCPPACPLSACPDPPSWQKDKLVEWNGATFTQSETLIPGWPESGSAVFALTLAPKTCDGMGNLNPAPGDVDVCSARWKTASGSPYDRFEWIGSTGVDSYRVYRGLLSEPPLENMTCTTPGGLEDTQLVEQSAPPAGDGYYFLIAEVINGQEGTLGKKSDDTPRTLVNPGSCD